MLITTCVECTTKSYHYVLAVLQSVLQRVGPGREANVSALSEVIDAASVDFGDLEKASQPVYARAFGQFIHQLSAPAANQSDLVQAFANSIVSALTLDRSGRNFRPNYGGPLIELTYAAGLEQSFGRAFTQVHVYTSSRPFSMTSIQSGSCQKLISTHLLN